MAPTRFERCPVYKILFLAFFLAAYLFIAAHAKASAVTRTWDGGGIDNNWNTAQNWSGDTMPTASDDAVFDTTSTKNATINSAPSVNSITIASGYTGIITQAAGVGVTVGTGGFSKAGGTFTGNNASITISGSFSNTSGTFTSTSGTLTIGGSFANNGTFTHNNGTAAFNSTTSGNTLSGTMTGTSSFNKVTFNGVGGSWTITDSIRISAANSTDALVIGNGTVTLGNGNGDSMEIDGKTLIANSAGQTATLQTALLPNGQSIIIDVNANTSTPSCPNCIISVGSTSGAGQGNLLLNKNTIVRLNARNTATASDAGIEVESTGYFRAQGSKDFTGNITTATETTITDTGKTFTSAEVGKSIKITSGLAKGRSYTITAVPTSTSLTIGDTSSADAVAATISQDGSFKKICSDSASLIATSSEGTGRYIRDKTGSTKLYKLITSTNNDASCSNNDSFTIMAEPDTFDIAANDTFEITDGIKAADSYEILDFVHITAESGTACTSATNESGEGYIYAKAGSETIMQYASVCNMGRSAQLGIVFHTINHANANEGATVDDSQFLKNYIGVNYANSTNNSFTSNYISYGLTGLTFNGSTGNTITDNFLENATNTSFSFGTSTNNTISGNTASFNDREGIYLFQSHKNTINNNTVYRTGLTIRLRQSRANAVNQNTVFNSDNGLYFNDSADGNSVTANKLYGNVYQGIFFYGCHNNYISGNQLNDNKADGIFLSYDSYSVIRDNSIYRNKGNGITLVSAPKAVTSGNSVYGNVGYGLQTDSQQAYVINDQFGQPEANALGDFNLKYSKSSVNMMNVSYTNPPTVPNGDEGLFVYPGKSASNIVGVAYDNWYNGILGLFYADGTYSVSSQNLNIDQGIIEQEAIYNYTLPAGKSPSMIVGITQESWWSGILTVFFNDGTYAATASGWNGSGDVTFTAASTYTVAAGKSYAMVIGLQQDIWNYGYLTAFYNDGTFSSASNDSWDGTNSVALPNLHTYSLPGGKSPSSVAGITSDWWFAGKLAVWFNDGTYADSSASGGFNSTTNIAVDSVYGGSKASAYFVSKKDNGIIGKTRVWGNYTIPSDITESPADESNAKYNFADVSWTANVTPHGYYGTGTEDSDLNYDISAADLSGGPYYYTLLCKTAGNGTTAVFDVYRNGSDIGDATAGTLFTDMTNGVNLKFKIDGGGSANYALYDIYSFAAYNGSGDTSTPKKLELAQNGDTFTIPGGKTLQAVGTSGVKSTITAANGVTYALDISGTLYGRDDDITVSGDLTLKSGGTLDATMVSMGRNFSNSGTFVHNSGIVQFVSTNESIVTGTTNFYRLSSSTAGKKLTFKAGQTFTFDGDFNLQGASGNPIILGSDTPGSAWTGSFHGTDNKLRYTTFKESGCSVGSANVYYNETNTNSGNNGYCFVALNDPNPTPEPTTVPTLTPTPTPSPKSSVGYTASVTTTPQPTATPEPTVSETPEPSLTVTPTPLPTASPTDAKETDVKKDNEGNSYREMKETQTNFGKSIKSLFSIFSTPKTKQYTSTEGSTLVLTDEAGNPAKSATVELTSIKRKFMTNADGVVVFKDVPDGTYPAQITIGSKVYSKTVTLKDKNTVDMQLGQKVSVIKLIVLAGIATFAFIVVKRSRKSKKAYSSGPSLT